MTMRCIKFKYGSDIRKLVVNEKCDTYEKMANLVRCLFKEKVPLGCVLRYKYVDGDGDLVSILNDEDWKLAFFSEFRLKVLVYPASCKVDMDPCRAIQDTTALSQNEAVNIAQHLAVVHTLLIRLIERISGENISKEGRLFSSMPTEITHFTSTQGINIPESSFGRPESRVVSTKVEKVVEISSQEDSFERSTRSKSLSVSREETLSIHRPSANVRLTGGISFTTNGIKLACNTAEVVNVEEISRSIETPSGSSIYRRRTKSVVAEFPVVNDRRGVSQKMRFPTIGQQPSFPTEVRQETHIMSTTDSGQTSTVFEEFTSSHSIIMTPGQNRLHVPTTSHTIRTIETSVVDTSMPPPVKTRSVMQTQVVRTERKNINKPPEGRNTVIKTASRVFERRPSNLFQYRLNPEVGRKFLHSTLPATHMVNDTYSTILMHVPEVSKRRITSHLVQPTQQMLFREKELPPRPQSVSRMQYVADNVRTPHSVPSRSPYCDDTVIALSVLPGEAISRCRKVSSVDVLHEAGQVSLRSFVGLDVCHNYSQRAESFAWDGLCFDELPLCSTRQNLDYDAPEPFGGRGPRSLHRRLTDPLPLFPCFRPTMDICPHHNEYQPLTSPTPRPHSGLMMTTYQADYNDAQWQQAMTNLTTTIKSVSPPATVRYLYQPLYASGTPQTGKEARCTRVYKAIGPQLCYPASSTGRNVADQVIQDSAILTENRRPDFLSNLPTAEVDRFKFELCPRPFGWTVGQFSSNLAREVRSPEELIHWDYSSRPRANCARQPLRPPACRQFGRVLSTAGIIGHRQQPMLPCMRISEEDPNRIINMRFGNDLNTYVVSSSRTGCLPSVRQTSTGSFVVNDVLDRQCGQHVGPIQSRTMNTTCSQMEQLLHHNFDTAQWSRWRSQLNPPPRCQITRARCVPYMQQFRIPPPPIFMHTITSMEDPVQACVQTVRRDADSNTCVLQNSINYPPVIQASDGSFIVSVSSETPFSGVPKKPLQPYHPTTTGFGYTQVPSQSTFASRVLGKLSTTYHDEYGDPGKLANPIIGTRQDGYTGFYVPFSSVPMKEKQERLRAFKNYMATLPPVTTPTYLSKPMKRIAEIEKKYIQSSVRSRSVMQIPVSGLQIVPVSSQGWVRSYSKEESTTVSTPSGHMLRKSKSTVSFISGTHSTSADTLADTVEYTEWSTSQPKVSVHKSVVTYAKKNRRPRAYSSVTRESIVLASPPIDSRQADASVYKTLSSSSSEVDEFLPRSQFAQEQTTSYTIEERLTPVSHIVKHSRRSTVSRRPLEVKKNARKISRITTADVSEPFLKRLPKGSILKARKVCKRISVVRSLSPESSTTTSYFEKHRKSRSASPRKSKSKDTSRRTTRKEEAEVNRQILARLRNFRSCECSLPSDSRPNRTSIIFRPGQPLPQRSRKSVAQVVATEDDGGYGGVETFPQPQSCTVKQPVNRRTASGCGCCAVTRQIYPCGCSPMYYSPQFMPTPSCGCLSVGGPPIPITVMPCVCCGIRQPSNPCACAAPKPSLPSKVTESPHTSADSLISPMFKILEEPTFTANHSALSPPQPSSVEFSPQSPRRLQLTESLPLPMNHTVPSSSPSHENAFFAANHRLLLKQRSPPLSPSESLPPPAEQRLAAPPIFESKHETTTTSISPQWRNTVPYHKSECGPDPSEQPNYLSCSTISKKIDSIRECSELTTISESLGKSETIQKHTKTHRTIVHYEDLTPDAYYAPRETETRKKTMNTVVNYEGSDSVTSYTPNAMVSHNRTVSTVVHYEETNPDATYAPQSTDSTEQVSEVIVPYEISPPEVIISPYLVNQYTTQDLESTTNLQLDTSETDMFTAVFKPDCPFGSSVEVKISTVCNCVLDDHMSRQNTISYEAQQGPTTKAIADTTTMQLSPAQIMKTIKSSSTTVAVEKDGNLFNSDAKHCQSNSIMRALSSKQPVPLSGEQVHYEMPAAMRTMQSSPMYSMEQPQCLNRSTGQACSPHGICTPVGPSTYIHVTTRTKCCQNHSCTHGGGQAGKLSPAASLLDHQCQNLRQSPHHNSCVPQGGYKIHVTTAAPEKCNRCYSRAEQQQQCKPGQTSLTTLQPFTEIASSYKSTAIDETNETCQNKTLDKNQLFVNFGTPETSSKSQVSNSGQQQRTSYQLLREHGSANLN